MAYAWKRLRADIAGSGMPILMPTAANRLDEGLQVRARR
jgi:hypothetical protein